MRLFHYHLVTSRVRQVEARYVGKLAFALVSRHGRIGEDYQSFPAGTSWEELDRMGFKLRLSGWARAVNVVVQPGQWELPRVDHLGIALDEDDFDAWSTAPSTASSASRRTGAGGRSSPRTTSGSRCIRRASGSRSCSRRRTRCG